MIIEFVLGPGLEPRSPECKLWPKIMWQYISLKSLMAKCLEQASQLHEMFCHDLENTSSNPG